MHLQQACLGRLLVLALSTLIQEGCPTTTYWLFARSYGGLQLLYLQFPVSWELFRAHPQHCAHVCGGIIRHVLSLLQEKFVISVASSTIRSATFGTVDGLRQINNHRAFMTYTIAGHEREDKRATFGEELESFQSLRQNTSIHTIVAAILAILQLWL